MSCKLTLHRRSLIGMALAFPWSVTTGANADTDQKIVSLDYGLASTLLALGITPAAVAARADWDKFVIEPPMPPGVADIGMTTEINLEVLARLKPALILSNPFFAMLRPRLEQIAPVKEFTIYAPDRKALPAAVAATRELGTLIGRGRQAENFLAYADSILENFRLRITRLGPPPVALVTLLDERHARIYGGTGLYQGVLERLGITNAWEKETSFWGFQTIALEELVALPTNTHLMIIEPLTPPDILHRLNDTPLWNRLPFAQKGKVSLMPGVLMFGMINEALRFGQLITDKLEQAA